MMMMMLLPLSLYLSHHSSQFASQTRCIWFSGPSSSQLRLLFIKLIFMLLREHWFCFSKHDMIHSQIFSGTKFCAREHCFCFKYWREHYPGLEDQLFHHNVNLPCWKYAVKVPVWWSHNKTWDSPFIWLAHTKDIWRGSDAKKVEPWTVEDGPNAMGAKSNANQCQNCYCNVNATRYWMRSINMSYKMLPWRGFSLKAVTDPRV